MKRLTRNFTLVLICAISVLASLGITQAFAGGTTRYHYGLAQFSTRECRNGYWEGDYVASGAVERRGNYGYNRDKNCLSSTEGTWYHGAFYSGGGVISCGASGAVTQLCYLDASKQGDPYIKNRECCPRVAAGSFLYL